MPRHRLEQLMAASYYIVVSTVAARFEVFVKPAADTIPKVRVISRALGSALEDCDARLPAMRESRRTHSHPLLT